MTDARDAPLQSLAVLVTRPQHQAQRLCELVAAAGGVAHAVPMLEILPAEDPAKVLAAIGDPADYDLLVFVSSNAVRHALDYLPGGPSTLAQIAAVGPSTARALRDAGLRCDVVPADGYASEDLLAEPAMRKVQGRRALIFRGNGGRALLGDTLAERGAQVTYADVYRRAVPAASAAQLQTLLDDNAVQVATATSVETLDNLMDMAGAERADALRALTLLTASRRVADKATSIGFVAAPIVADGPDDQALLDALVRWHGQEHGAGDAQDRVSTGANAASSDAPNATSATAADTTPPEPATTDAAPGKRRKRRRSKAADSASTTPSGSDTTAPAPDTASAHDDPAHSTSASTDRSDTTGSAAETEPDNAAVTPHSASSPSAAAPKTQETQPMTTSAPADAASAAPAKPARGGTLLGALALLIALLACAAAGWNWREAQQARTELAALVVNLPDGESIVADARRQVEQSGDALRRDVDARIARVDLSAVSTLSSEQDTLSNMVRGQARSISTLTDRLSGLEQDLGALQGVSTSVRDTWVRAETEYFLQTANSRLQLAHDVDSALQALRAADARIGALGDPALTPVRSLVAEEILAVEAIPRPDVQGIALALGGLAERVPSLPIDALSPEAYSVDAPVDAQASGWQRFKDSVTGVLGNIVRVSPSDGSSGDAVMPPEQSWFLYRNLELQLHAARLALLDRDQENYRTSLVTAARWLDDHFIADDPAVASATARLEELSEMEIDPPMPDISRSLRRLRDVVATTGTSAP